MSNVANSNWQQRRRQPAKHGGSVLGKRGGYLDFSGDPDTLLHTSGSFCRNKGLLCFPRSKITQTGRVSGSSYGLHDRDEQTPLRKNLKVFHHDEGHHHVLQLTTYPYWCRGFESKSPCQTKSSLNALPRPSLPSWMTPSPNPPPPCFILCHVATQYISKRIKKKDVCGGFS